MLHIIKLLILKKIPRWKEEKNTNAKWRTKARDERNPAPTYHHSWRMKNTLGLCIFKYFKKSDGKKGKFFILTGGFFFVLILLTVLIHSFVDIFFSSLVSVNSERAWRLSVLKISRRIEIECSSLPRQRDVLILLLNFSESRNVQSLISQIDHAIRTDAHIFASLVYLRILISSCIGRRPSGILWVASVLACLISIWFEPYSARIHILHIEGES